MLNGWSHNFDLDSVPEELVQSIRDNIKKWDDAARIWSEERLNKLREDVERVKAEHDEFVGNDKLRTVSTPEHVQCVFCPCMNGGDGGIVSED